MGFAHIILHKDIEVSKAVPWGRKTLTSICIRQCLDTIRQSVSISINFRRLATRWTVQGSNPGGGKIFRTCPDWPWGLPRLLYKRYQIFPGVKQLWHGVDHPPPYSAKTKERIGPYLYFPYGPSWPVIGWTLPLPLNFRRWIEMWFVSPDGPKFSGLARCI